MLPRFMAGITSALCLAALAHITTVQAKASTTPVAYVYVVLGSSINSYATAADGTLTAIQSQPTQGHNIWHVSVTKKFLYGIDGASDISMFSIGPNGALTPIGVLNASSYDPDNCFASGDLQVDETGTNLYTLVGDCDRNSYLVSFKILSTGELVYLGRAHGDSYAISPIRFTENNRYAFQTGCLAKTGSPQVSSATAETGEYKRESNGYLTYLGTTHEVPEGSGDKSFCPFMMTSHGNELVFEYLRFEPGEFYGLNYPLGVYTVASDGKLSTKSDYENMAFTEVYPTTMSISPSGAVLAAAGDEGFEFFHLSGSKQPVAWETFPADPNVTELGWDNADHFYALTSTSLVEYSVTSTSYKKLTGLPNAFTNAGSLIVLSVKDEEP
jgi:hypothetical protein